jgi:hypothetical protein
VAARGVVDEEGERLRNRRARHRSQEVVQPLDRPAGVQRPTQRAAAEAVDGGAALRLDVRDERHAGRHLTLERTGRDRREIRLQQDLPEGSGTVGANTFAAASAPPASNAAPAGESIPIALTPSQPASDERRSDDRVAVRSQARPLPGHAGHHLLRLCHCSRTAASSTARATAAPAAFVAAPAQGASGLIGRSLSSRRPTSAVTRSLANHAAARAAHR